MEVSGVTWLVRLGVDSATVKSLTRWLSDMIWEYAKEVPLDKPQSSGKDQSNNLASSLFVLSYLRFVRDGDAPFTAFLLARTAVLKRSAFARRSPLRLAAPRGDAFRSVFYTSRSRSQRYRARARALAQVSLHACVRARRARAFVQRRARASSRAGICASRNFVCAFAIARSQVRAQADALGRACVGAPILGQAANASFAIAYQHSERQGPSWRTRPWPMSLPSNTRYSFDFQCGGYVRPQYDAQASHRSHAHV